MKAVVMNRYGGPEVLEIKEIDRPEPNENQILVRVEASSVNAGDLFSVKGSPWMVRFMVGFPKPRSYVLGWDVAGRVEEVGAKVTMFRPGDEVFGGSDHAFAEYVADVEDRFSKRPANLSPGEAAAMPSAGTTALQALRDHGKVKPGHKVLINGASGGVGSFAVQIAKALGAEVTGVCSSAKVDMVRSLGADRVVDYTKEDFTRAEQRYDLILDNAASRAISDLKRVLAPGGLILPNSGHGGMGYVVKSYLLSFVSRRHGRPFLAVPNHKDLDVLKEYYESGKVKPVIDKTYPLSEIQQAIGYLDQGHPRGKVVITVGDTK